MSGFEEGDPLCLHRVRADDLPGQRRRDALSPGTVIEYQVPDMYGRPWAALWERYLEQDMEKPEKDDIFSFE